MIAIILFPTVAPSLFSALLDGSREYPAAPIPDYEADHRVADDQWAFVDGWSLREGSALDSLDLAGRARWPGGAPSWVTDLMEEAAHGARAVVGEQAVVLEAFETYRSAQWVRVRLTDDGPEALIFRGKRAQFRAHTCGWAIGLAGAERVVVLTTQPDRVPTLIEGLPHEAAALPKPEDWASPEDRDRQTYFAVWDRARGEGHIDYRRGLPFPYPGGWTLQEIEGMGRILYEGPNRDDAQTRLDREYQFAAAAASPSA